MNNNINGLKVTSSDIILVKNTGENLLLYELLKANGFKKALQVYYYIDKLNTFPVTVNLRPGLSSKDCVCELTHHYTLQL